MTSDVLAALDEGQACIMVLLDLSAAFDTLDHNILISRLETSFGVTGNALKWLASYLSDRQQSVVINGEISTPLKLSFGVPQGSVVSQTFTVHARFLQQRLNVGTFHV